ncbi:MAG: (5-formylfuran-3-yl)methyl phosphate synthase [Methylophilus sp.]
MNINKTKLLVSVKNVHEASLALQAGVDFIDLKDPEVGALGSLDDEISKEIIRSVNKMAVISATIGEYHRHQQAVLDAIDTKISMGVDIVKLSITHHFKDVIFLQNLEKIIFEQDVKLVAVMFADEMMDFSWIPKLANLGFYGVMLDTSNKKQNLLSSVSEGQIQAFVNDCKSYHLQMGLAGSLRVEYIDNLIKYSPDYIGFRSGVCVNFQRDSDLLLELVLRAKDKLYKHNINGARMYA